MNADHDMAPSNTADEARSSSEPTTQERPRRQRPRRRFRGLLALIVALLVVIAGGWVLAGPPNGPLPAWARWSLPDISTMQLSNSGRFGLVTKKDESTIIDLTTGKSNRIGRGIRLPGSHLSAGAFVTDKGTIAIVDDDSVTAYDRHGRRLWRAALDGFEDPEYEVISEDTVVIDDYCHGHSQHLLGIDLKSGKVRWRDSLDTCIFHADGTASRTMFQVPTDAHAHHWAVRTIDQNRTVRNFAEDHAWAVRGEKVLTIRDGRMVATRYPQRTRTWSTDICPRSTKPPSLDGHEGYRGDTAASIVVTCGNGSQWIVDTRNGRHAQVPDWMDASTRVQPAATTLIGVQQAGHRILGIDLLNGHRLWSLKKPAGDVTIDTSTKYAIITSNHHSHHTFSVVNLTTGKERAHSPAWGNWWAGSAGSQGVWITHRSLCAGSDDCKLHSTYLLR